MKILKQVQLVALAGFLACATVSAGPVKVVPVAQGGAFPIVAVDGSMATIVFDASDAEVVATAAQAVSDDIRLITGKSLKLTNTLKGVKCPIIAGTLGRSSLVDTLVAAGKIDVSGVAGKWEAYGLAVVNNPTKEVSRALVAYGSTPRGTAYALFELSRLMGVSPYVWWADVLPQERDALYATAGKTIVGEPSVKFRGIFINDEDWGLTPWAAKNIDSRYNNIGPNTYAKVMELLLRLRANVLWPAMHLCSQAFWDNKDNLPVAKKYDIALGSSHCEQMLRDNEWEWRRYDNNSGTNENWNYVTNKEKIQRYWEERVEESKGFSVMYTLGMRGVHDWGISGYPSTQDKVRGLTEIIAFQRSLIKKHIADPTTVPQIFIPYKEVLEAYNAGLEVPEDVILTWVDDNHGYVRQLPTMSEQKRSGGHGVYYHLSYWGTPADYLWLCSTSPSLISYELVKGYENGIRDLWVINVGDIKPAEAELEFCMDLAWDVNAWQPQKAYEYNRHWAAKTFGEAMADAISGIKLEYYELGAAGKPEHVFGVGYNNAEMNDRIDRYTNLVNKVEALSESVPSRLRDAYFELIEYPVKGAYYMNLMTFRAKQSRSLSHAGHREKALAYAAEAHEAYRMIEHITEKYNIGIANGKWDGIMDSKPRKQPQFFMPETATASSISPYLTPLFEEEFSTVAAADYVASKGSIKEFRGLGIGKSSVTVWPMDYNDYSCDYAKAPYVEYSVPVRAGQNTIEIRCVPSFPIHSGGSLKVAVSVDGGEPVVTSLKTVATEGKWNNTVLQGYNDASVAHIAKEDGCVKVRVLMLNPGIAISEIYTRFPMKM
ncbi:MAG: glycosyl hydrolase 115 family protein [Bacteroidales bacterium]|nr:glycosyl hydrolase 115 family protein [Bacteroidales bacterium]